LGPIDTPIGDSLRSLFRDSKRSDPPPRDRRTP
jgi:hypothetical protein